MMRLNFFKLFALVFFISLNFDCLKSNLIEKISKKIDNKIEKFKAKLDSLQEKSLVMRKVFIFKINSVLIYIFSLKKKSHI